MGVDDKLAYSDALLFITNAAPIPTRVGRRWSYIWEDPGGPSVAFSGNAQVSLQLSSPRCGTGPRRHAVLQQGQ